MRGQESERFWKERSESFKRNENGHGNKQKKIPKCDLEFGKKQKKLSAMGFSNLKEKNKNKKIWSKRERRGEREGKKIEEGYS